MRLSTQPSSQEEMRRSVAVFPVLRPLFKAFRKEIGILFDFTPVLMPWVHAPETVRHFRAFFGKAAPLYDSVIAISESTRSDAVWLSTIASDKVTTCYPGPSLCERSHARIEKKSGRVILAVASLEPRKNAPFLIKWFLKSEAIEPGTELWWAGAQAWWASDAETKELQQLAESRKDRKIKFLGFVSDNDLCGLYQSSTMTVYPSLYEGFGFPVLDSLLHNTPVLTSYNSSLVEFEGPGVFHFDPYDQQSLDAAYRECLGKRGEFSIDIDALRKRYRWENVAKRIRQL
jgi:glycosyltransferase involved in cell wall biosynthesis